MKRILIVTRNYPPLWGGMERLNLHLVDELSRRCEVRLIAPEGAAEYTPPNVQLAHVPLRPLSRFLATAGWRTLQQARTWKPEVILAGSGLTAPLSFLAARLCGARAFAYVHGLDLTVPHPVYRALWRPALRRLDGLIANSNATAKLASDIGISSERISIVPPGVSQHPFDPCARERFRRAHDLETRTVLLSVGRLAARKGLKEFVADTLPLIAAERPDILFVVVGSAPNNALYAEAQSPESIQHAAEQAGVGAHMRFLGNLSNSELQDAYAGADLHVFPVRDIPNDPEGFGMVAIEAAAHGLATVAYATGGIVDAIGTGQSGLLVSPGDAAAFASSTLSLLQTPLDSTGVRAFAEHFAWSKFGARVSEAIGRCQ